MIALVLFGTFRGFLKKPWLEGDVEWPSDGADLEERLMVIPQDFFQPFQGQGEFLILSRQVIQGVPCTWIGLYRYLPKDISNRGDGYYGVGAYCLSETVGGSSLWPLLHYACEKLTSCIERYGNKSLETNALDDFIRDLEWRDKTLKLWANVLNSVHVPDMKNGLGFRESVTDCVLDLRSVDQDNVKPDRIIDAIQSSRSLNSYCRILLSSTDLVIGKFSENLYVHIFELDCYQDKIEIIRRGKFKSDLKPSTGEIIDEKSFSSKNSSPWPLAKSNSNDERSEEPKRFEYAARENKAGYAPDEQRSKTDNARYAQLIYQTFSFSLTVLLLLGCLLGITLTVASINRLQNEVTGLTQNINAAATRAQLAPVSRTVATSAPAATQGELNSAVPDPTDISGIKSPVESNTVTVPKDLVAALEAEHSGIPNDIKVWNTETLKKCLKDYLQNSQGRQFCFLQMSVNANIASLSDVERLQLNIPPLPQTTH